MSDIKTMTKVDDEVIYTINGGNVLIFGDLHLSSTYTGQHKDYTYDCYKTMDIILEKVKKFQPSAVFFLGDLIGVRERNIKDRQFLFRVILFFTSLNEVTNWNVYSVKGNHDFGGFSDFDMLTGLGYVKNPSYVDYCTPDGSIEVRFHLVNYGEEERELYLADTDGASNIVLGHSDFTVEGVTDWYRHKNSVFLSRLKNFIGVDMVISGHIHTPSDEFLSVSVCGVTTLDLFYTGSPSRTSERFDDCWYLIFSYTGKFTKYDADLMGLDPADKVFYPKGSFVGVSEEEEEQSRADEALTSIVKEIMEGRLLSGDLFKQIRLVPGASEVAKDLACSYLQRAIEEVV